MVDGDESNLTDSSELLWKEIPKFVALHTLLHVIILLDDLRDKALLPVYPSELGVVSDDGAVMNSGELLRWIARNRGDERGIERV
jgi:hypothetical protein